MEKSGFSRRDLPLALAGTFGVTAAVFAQDEETQPDDPPLPKPYQLQMIALEQQYDLSKLSDDERTAVLTDLYRQQLRSKALRQFPLSSGAEPATAFLAAPTLTHGGDDDAD